jgi:O-antigen ligase
MMAMIVGYLIVIVLSYKNKFDMRKNGILALMLLLAMPIAIDVGPRVIDRFLNASEASGASRKLANVAAAAMADDHFFGVGLNNYSHAINETHYIEHIDSIVDRGIVHNIYLLHASEMGWIGMIAFCLVIGNFLRLGYRSISTSSSELASNVAIGLTTAIVVLSMQGSLEWFFRQTYITIEFFMFAGFLVAIPKVSVATNRQRKINQYMKKIALSR